MDYTTLRHGDELVVGPLTGVRFWTYDRNLKIASWQWFHVWTPSRPTVASEAHPHVPGRGINVYKTQADALRGSAEAIRSLEDMLGCWCERECGIVLGQVEFWGEVYEHEFGYTAEIVRPTKFLRAWGARAADVPGELNAIWFPILSGAP